MMDGFKGGELTRCITIREGRGKARTARRRYLGA